MPPKRQKSTKSQGTGRQSAKRKIGKGQPDPVFPAPASVSNLWTLSSKVTDEDIQDLMSHSYSCSLSNLNVKDNTVTIMHALSTGKAGEFVEDCTRVGRIPTHYFQGARLTLHMSVYYLSLLMVGWGTSSDEVPLVLGAQRLANYHRQVFLDLLHAMEDHMEPISDSWRWERFDNHLHREFHLLGNHDTEDPKVQNFQPPIMYATAYGKSALP
jgi:hypothetical protein